MGARACGPPKETEAIERAWTCRCRVATRSGDVQVEVPSFTSRKSVARFVILRKKLDRMSTEQFVWQPYSSRIMQDYSQTTEESRLWRDMIPLLNFEEVEWHRLDRVMR